MKIEFWGVRGTTPISGKDKNKYGGYTLCTSVFTSEGEWIIIDAGTGIKKLGDCLLKQGGKEPLNLHILLTHFHLDHIIGIPFFTPLYSPKVTLSFYATCSPEETEKYLSGLMTGRYFPLDFKKTPSKKTYNQIPEEDFHIGKTRISHCPLPHPQGNVGFKIQENNKYIVYATDTEHPEKGLDKRLVSFAQGADILIYDAMYTPEEYESGKRGWGHSTWLEGTKIAREARVRELYLSHFNPDHSDEQVDKIIALACEKFPQTQGAREEVKPVI
jgi:phosphoribosyl 1,2-cyclic phosphodiesterase